MAAIGLALIGTMGLPMFRDVLSNRVLFRTEIEKSTTIPVIGEIAYAGKNKSIIAEKKPEVQNDIKQLSTAAGLFSRDNTRKKVLITSAMSGEGKTFISSNLGYNLALAGKRVVMVDMNMMDKQLSDQFNVDDAPGIAEFLDGDVEAVSSIIKPTDYENLYIIPAGDIQTNTTNLLLNGRLERLLEQLYSEYDFIIMDSAAVNHATDGYILSDLSDITLFVTRHRHTPKSAIKRLDETNDLKPLKNIACVFNGVKPRGFIIKAKSHTYGMQRA